MGRGAHDLDGVVDELGEPEDVGDVLQRRLRVCADRGRGRPAVPQLSRHYTTHRSP